MGIHRFYFALILLFLGTSCGHYGVFDSVNGCDLQPGANCDGANLQRTILRWYDLTDGQFRNADLRGAFLSNTLLTNAVLDGADLTNAVIDGTIFDGASCDGTTWIDGTVLSGNCVNETCRDFFGFEATEDLTVSKIKSRFKQLVLIYHPDKGGTQEQFVRLSACRDELLNQL